MVVPSTANRQSDAERLSSSFNQVSRLFQASRMSMLWKRSPLSWSVLRFPISTEETTKTTRLARDGSSRDLQTSSPKMKSKFLNNVTLILSLRMRVFTLETLSPVPSNSYKDLKLIFWVNRKNFGKKNYLPMLKRSLLSMLLVLTSSPHLKMTMEISSISLNQADKIAKTNIMLSLIRLPKTLLCRFSITAERSQELSSVLSWSCSTPMKICLSSLFLVDSPRKSHDQELVSHAWTRFHDWFDSSRDLWPCQALFEIFIQMDL